MGRILLEMEKRTNIPFEVVAANAFESAATGRGEGILSFGELFDRLWRRRVLLFVVPILALLGGVAIGALLYLRTAEPIVLFVSLNGIENGKYANGTEFSPQDLLVPAVTDRLRTEFRLGSPEEIRRNITVSYDSPISEGVIKKYRGALGARGLTQVEIDSINARYQEELSKTTHGGLRIEVRHAPLGVSESTAIAIAKAVPRLWSEVFSEQFRIHLDTALADSAITTNREDLASSTSVMSAHRRLQNIARGLDVIVADGRLAKLETTDNFTSTDLKENVGQFRLIFFNPIFATAFSQDDPVSLYYLKEKQLEINDLERQVVGLDRTIDDLRRYQKPPAGTLQDGDAPAPGFQGGAVQFGADSLDAIVGLAERASFSQYLQRLFEARQRLTETISGLRKDIEFSAAATATNLSFPREAAAEQLDLLTRRYRELLDGARAQLADQTGQLYSELSSPGVVGPIVPMASMAIAAAIFLLGLVAAFVVAIVYPVRTSPINGGSPMPNTQIA